MRREGQGSRGKSRDVFSQMIDQELIAVLSARKVSLLYRMQVEILLTMVSLL